MGLAFRRLFRVRMRLGLLDPPTTVPYSDANAVRYNATELQFNAEHLVVAARAAREAMTLLKNDGTTLPLDVTALKNIAVVGPQANESVRVVHAATSVLTTKMWCALVAHTSCVVRPCRLCHRRHDVCATHLESHDLVGPGYRWLAKHVHLGHHHPEAHLFLIPVCCACAVCA